MRASLVVLAVGVTLGAIPLACLDATQATILVTTNVECGPEEPAPDTLYDSGVGATSKQGTPERFHARTKHCAPADGGVSDVGSAVVHPENGAEQASVIVVGAIGTLATADACLQIALGRGDAALLPSCIIARRVVRFVDHTELEVPVLLDLFCAGVDCGDGKTCVREEGRAVCAEAEVTCRGTKCDTEPGTGGAGVGGGGVGGGGVGGAGAMGGGGGGGAGAGGAGGGTLETLYDPGAAGATVHRAFGFDPLNPANEPLVLFAGTDLPGLPPGPGVGYLLGPAWVPQGTSVLPSLPNRIHGAGTIDGPFLVLASPTGAHRYDHLGLAVTWLGVGAEVVGAHMRAPTQAFVVGGDTHWEWVQNNTQPHPHPGTSLSAVWAIGAEGVAMGDSFCDATACSPHILDGDVVDAWSEPGNPYALVLTEAGTVILADGMGVPASTGVTLPDPAGPSPNASPTRLVGRTVLFGDKEVWVGGTRDSAGGGLYLARIVYGAPTTTVTEYELLPGSAGLDDLWVDGVGRAYVVANDGLHRFTPF